MLVLLPDNMNASVIPTPPFWKRFFCERWAASCLLQSFSIQYLPDLSQFVCHSNFPYWKYGALLSRVVFSFMPYKKQGAALALSQILVQVVSNQSLSIFMKISGSSVICDQLSDI